MPTSPYFNVQVRHTSLNCYTAGLGFAGFSDVYNLRMVNPLDVVYKYSEKALVNHHGASPIMDNMLAARSLQCVGGYYDHQYPYQTAHNLSLLNDDLKAMNEDEAGFLLLRLKDSGGWEDFRLHCKFQNMIAPMQPGTQMMATQSLMYNFRMHDPGIYRNTGQTTTHNVVAGNYASTLNNSGSRVAANRCTIKIQHTGGGNPTNVVVSIGGESFIIADTLTSNYWFLDCHEGWARYNSITRNTGTDKIDKFAGRFPRIATGAAVPITITDTAATNFTVYVDWLHQWW